MCRTLQLVKVEQHEDDVLTSAGHEASSGNAMSYRMLPQRHPPVIFSGRADMSN